MDTARSLFHLILDCMVQELFRLDNSQSFPDLSDFSRYSSAIDCTKDVNELPSFADYALMVNLGPFRAYLFTLYIFHCSTNKGSLPIVGNNSVGPIILT